MTNPTVTVDITIDGVTVEYYDAEIIKGEVIIEIDGAKCAVPYTAEQGNAIEEIVQEHEQHLRDEAHYDREIADTDRPNRGRYNRDVDIAFDGYGRPMR